MCTDYRTTKDQYSKMNIAQICFFFFMYLLYGTEAGKKSRVRGVKWWTLATANYAQQQNEVLESPFPVYSNPNLQPLTRKQRRLVVKNPGTIVSIAKGARMAIEECKYQFRNRRWNCPTYDSNRVFGKILKKGFRETAFIYAITSSALAHQVALACSEGSVYTCTCGQRLGAHPRGKKEWEWGGCSDNAAFGHKFSRDFVDIMEKGQDLRYMMNLHNNEAGRMHISTEMEQECKCHGMSGSCTMKTCWMRLPSFHRVGTKLKDKFDGASRVYQGNSGNRSRRDKMKLGKGKKIAINLQPINPNHKPPGDKDLVYYEKSPSFCAADKSIDFPGTKGRQCNETSFGLDGCDLLCCDRGYKTETYVAKERCSCVFHWCCKVTCQTCTRTRVRHVCL